MLNNEIIHSLLYHSYVVIVFRNILYSLFFRSIFLSENIADHLLPPLLPNHYLLRIYNYYNILLYMDLLLFSLLPDLLGLLMILICHYFYGLPRNYLSRHILSIFY